MVGAGGQVEIATLKLNYEYTWKIFILNNNILTQRFVWYKKLEKQLKKDNKSFKTSITKNA